MGIPNWIKFNENLNENFTREMAQEILYFFNTYHQDRKLSELFFKKPEIETGHHFDMYETGYDEINQMISRLLNLFYIWGIDRSKDAKMNQFRHMI